MAKKKAERVTTFEKHVEVKETQMGMSVIDFHKKLNDLLTPEYIAQVEENRLFLEKWLQDGLPIYTTQTKNRKELILQEDEFFVPCFHPEQPVRNELPTYWFYSNYANIVSVTGKKKRSVHWLPPKEDKNGHRGCQKIKHKVTGKKKSIPQYVIGSLIFRRDHIFGGANEMLELFGSYAYGVKGDPWNVQAHHETSLENDPMGMYDHTIIGTLDSRAHELLRTLRALNNKARKASSPEKVDQLNVEAMARIAATLDEEGCTEPVIIQAGNADDPSKGAYSYRTLSDPDCPLSKEQVEYIKNFIKSVEIALTC